MVEAGEFREDLLWRINGKKLSLPPLRERTEDIKALAEYFLCKDPFRKKTLQEDALEAMKSYPWPGNVRELRRVCEQLLLNSPLPILRKEDVAAILQSKVSSVSQGVIDYSKGLPEILDTFEADVVTKCLEQYKDVDEVSKILKISRSSLYKKIKDHNIDWRQ